jgi:protocatechuate 3,4-dioxygenase alpha subunit
MIHETTPSQTVGPYLHLALPWPDGPHAVTPDAPGAIEVVGTVLDGDGQPIPDALVETWQADPDGGFAHSEQERGEASVPERFPGFRGFGRCPTDPDGRFRIVTLKPGRVAWTGGPPGEGAPALQAPHVDVSIFARGLLHRLVTRWYFADEPEANATDPVLRSVDPRRRSTLLMEPVAGGYRLDVRTQGTEETVFFDV